MPKRYFEIKEISRDLYFKKAQEAGKKENPSLVRASSGGSMQVDKKTFLAYTSDDELEVALDYEEMD